MDNMLRRYAEQILNLYNFIDGMMIVNADAKVEYFITYRPDVNLLKEQNLIGRYLLDIYPSLTEENSSIIRVLRTGKPIFNEYQVLSTYDGQNLRAVNTTLPIKEGDTIVGVVDVSRYIDSDIERQDIVLQIKEADDVKTMYTIDDIVTSSMQMEIIKERIGMIADTDSSVLIYGETGTGNEQTGTGAGNGQTGIGQTGAGPGTCSAGRTKRIYAAGISRKRSERSCVRSIR